MRSMGKATETAQHQRATETAQHEQATETTQHERGHRARRARLGLLATRRVRRVGRLGLLAARLARRLGLLAALLVVSAGVLAGGHAGVPLAQAAGNSDAAHACQHGGYANLAGFGSNGQVFTFQNEGQCVSYAAHGGVFTTPLPACTVTATSGCLTFNGITFPSAEGTGNSITLTGATSFDDACSGICQQSVLPNALATGGGAYVETNSSGAVISQGAYRVADTAGSQEGLFAVGFSDATGNATACTTASNREIIVLATLIDASTGAMQAVNIGAGTDQTDPTLGFGEVDTNADLFFSRSVPSSTITC